MNQASGLRCQGFNQPRMGMAQGIHGDAGESIQISATLFIVDVGPLPMGEGDRQPGKNIHQMRHGNPVKQSFQIVTAALAAVVLQETRILSCEKSHLM